MQRHALHRDELRRGRLPGESAKVELRGLLGRYRSQSVDTLNLGQSRHLVTDIALIYRNKLPLLQLLDEFDKLRVGKLLGE